MCVCVCVCVLVGGGCLPSQWFLPCKLNCRDLKFPQPYLSVFGLRVTPYELNYTSLPGFQYSSLLILIQFIFCIHYHLILHKRCTFSITSLIHYLWFINGPHIVPFLTLSTPPPSPSFFFTRVCVRARVYVFVVFLTEPQVSYTLYVFTFLSLLLGTSCVWLMGFPPATQVFPFIFCGCWNEYD